jgi:thymidylate synthase
MYTRQGDVNTIYPSLVRQLLGFGQDITNPNKPDKFSSTKEIRPVMLSVTDTPNPFVTSYGRTINLPFALAECIWILTGKNDVETLQFYNSQIAQFSDDGKTFHAAYGDRLRHWGVGTAHRIDQIREVIYKLADNRQSRQAVMSLWDPYKDNVDISKDYPCNDFSHVMIRENKLTWMQVLRSNDIIWGMPYNFIQWCVIQNYIATRLNVEAGPLTYVADSLHIYEDKIEEARKINYFDLMRGLPKQESFSTEDYQCESIYHVGNVEQFIRTRESSEELESRHTYRMSAEGRFWQDAIQVLLAWKYFKMSLDNKAFDIAMQIHSGQFKLMLLKNFYQMRWHKDLESPVAIALLKTIGDNPAVYNWMVRDVS